jgi:hypothetical protein
MVGDHRRDHFEIIVPSGEALIREMDRQPASRSRVFIVYWGVLGQFGCSSGRKQLCNLIHKSIVPGPVLGKLFHNGAG